MADPRSGTSPVIRSVEFYNIELAPLADGRVYVSMLATTVDDEEPQLLTQEIACNTVATIEDALAVIRQASVGIIIDERGTTALIEIDSGLYSEHVALRAGYWLTDRCHVHVGRPQEGGLTAEIRRKDGKSGDALSEVCGEFCNGLIDFAIRERVALETRGIHEALIQRAFFELVPKPSNVG